MKINVCKLVNCEECSKYRLGENGWYCTWPYQYDHDFFDFLTEEKKYEYTKDMEPCMFCQSCEHYDKENNVCNLT